ncbi:MAG: hypothetical protein IJX46_02570 [Clostridia bacterium]|nr:hypothetical protein [Clostridia bacterium]
MKNKGDVFLDAITNIDDDLLNEALDIDTAKKLCALKSKNIQSSNLKKKYAAIFVACFTLAVLLIICTVGGLMTANTPEPVGSETSPPGTTPSVPDIVYPGGENIVINSFDKVNYYAAHKLLSSNGSTPLSSTSAVGDEYTITSAINFFITVTDEHEFLASKVGLGRAEVVVGEFQDLLLITFKNGENFFTCVGGESEIEDNSLQFFANDYMIGYARFTDSYRRFSFSLNYDTASNTVGKLFYEDGKWIQNSSSAYSPEKIIQTPIEIEHGSIETAYGSYTFSFSSLAEYYNAQYFDTIKDDPFSAVTVDGKTPRLLKYVIETENGNTSETDVQILTDISAQTALTDKLGHPTVNYTGELILPEVPEGTEIYSDAVYERIGAELEQHLHRNFDMIGFFENPLRGEWFIVFTLSLRVEDENGITKTYKGTYTYKLVVTKPFGREDYSSVPPDCNAEPEDFPVEDVRILSGYGFSDDLLGAYTEEDRLIYYPMPISMYMSDGNGEVKKWEIAYDNDIYTIFKNNLNDIPHIRQPLGAIIDIPNGGEIIYSKIYTESPADGYIGHSYVGGAIYYLDRYAGSRIPSYVEFTVEWVSGTTVRQNTYLFACTGESIETTLFKLPHQSPSVANGTDTVTVSLYMIYDATAAGLTPNAYTLVTNFQDLMATVKYSDNLSLELNGGKLRRLTICYMNDQGVMIENKISDPDNWQSLLPGYDCYVKLAVEYEHLFGRGDEPQVQYCIFKIDCENDGPPLYKEKPITTYSGRDITFSSGENSVTPMIIGTRTEYIGANGQKIVEESPETDRYLMLKHAGDQIPVLKYSGDLSRDLSEGLADLYTFYWIDHNPTRYQALALCYHHCYGLLEWETIVNELASTISNSDEPYFDIVVKVSWVEDGKTVTNTYLFRLDVSED